MSFNIVVTDSNPEELQFDLENCSCSFPNALRRLILTDVNTIGFATEDYENSSIRVVENTSSLHNEFLLHRFSLIPVYFHSVKDFDPSHYKFTLNKTNKTTAIIDVTTNDFTVFNTITGKDEKTSEFFPVNSITGDGILIVRLKPSPNGDGEQIHLEGSAVVQNGSFNAGFSPVSAVMFTNKIDQTKLDTAVANAEKDPTVTDINQFKIANAERYYMTDDNNEANVFSFTIESVGVITPKNILIDACHILINKLNQFKEELEKALNEDKTDKITVVDSPTVMNAKDIIIENESHTLGYILQDYIVKTTPSEQLLFAAYKNPHPLEKKIVLRVAFNEGNQFQLELNRVCDHLIKMCQSVISKIMTEVE
jgi:DNA-directed RNA polymerase subunit L